MHVATQKIHMDMLRAALVTAASKGCVFWRMETARVSANEKQNHQLWDSHIMEHLSMKQQWTCEQHKLHEQEMPAHVRSTHSTSRRLRCGHENIPASTVLRLQKKQAR